MTLDHWSVVYDEGVKAYRAGQPIESNPYGSSGDLWSEFRYGWCRSKADEETPD